MIENKAIRNQVLLANKLNIVKALYGSKTELVHFVELIKLSHDAQNNKSFVAVAEEAQANDRIYNKMVDVTTAVRFALETKPDRDGKCGLRINGAKKSLSGFINPIPPCLKESKTPTLCIIY